MVAQATSHQSMRCCILRRRAGRLCAAAILLCGAGARVEGADVTAKDVNRAISLGVKYLRSTQRSDGSWRYDSKYIEGATALALLAMLNAGVPADDPAIERGLKFVSQYPFRMTYSTSLIIMVLAQLDNPAYADRIRQGANWLMALQNKDGSWGYNPSTRRGDLSNTQFALLGLREAMRVGAPVHDLIWVKAERYLLGLQQPSGGWCYTKKYRQVTGSMTCAGIASLFILDGLLHCEKDVCGEYEQAKQVSVAMRWLERNFTVERNPQYQRWHYYYLYALERVGVISARKYLGGHDWYLDGARFLTKAQDKSGSWGGLTNTCFALLFLAKGKANVLFHKLHWRGDWNNDRHDIANLTAFISETWKQPLSWQVVQLSTPMAELLHAPILYLNGHTAPKFTDDEINKLRDYVQQGGFIFAEACCGRKEFFVGIEDVLRRMYPDRKLEPLPRDHLIYNMYFKLKGDVPPLLGLTSACRTSIIVSPTDLSCAWEKREFDSGAFEMGTNIAAYATGMERLKGKLDHIETLAPVSRAKPPRGALVLAQLRHPGEWNTDPICLRRLLQELRKRADIDVAPTKRVVAPLDPDLFQYPILYLTGHGKLRYTDAETAALRTYLDRGGFIFCDACCGNKEFDASFRTFVRKLYPDTPLQRIPNDHPIFESAYAIRTVRYSWALAKELGPSGPPVFEGIMREDRPCLVYSPYDLGCAIEGHPCPHCRGVVRDDAIRLAVNVIVYALTE